MKTDKQKIQIEYLENKIAGNKNGIGIMYIGLIIFLPLSILAWHISSSFLLMIGFLGVFACIMIICTSISEISKLQQELKKVKTDYDDYEKEQEHLETIREVEREVDIRVEAAKHPQCPICGSLQTRKISTTNRAVSVYFFGLISDKIGKQYECLKCRHKW